MLLGRRHELPIQIHSNMLKLSSLGLYLTRRPLATLQTKWSSPKHTTTKSQQYANNKKPSTSTEEAKTQQEAEFNEQQIDFSQFNPNKFGDVSSHYRGTTSATVFQEPLKAESLKDEADGYDTLEIKRGPKKSIEAYCRIWNELFRKSPMDVAEILRLHREFIYEDRYIPDKYMYTVLFAACAHAGYTKKAVELYDEMRRYELMPSRPAVTALINACANCTHTSEYGLKQVKNVREKLQLAGYELNDIHYNCLIKAFARLGDMNTAYSTLQEMIDKGHSVDSNTYAMLLMGCISDRKQGLFEATRILSNLTHSRRLTLSTVNLFLRCVRDCEMDSTNLQQLCSKTVPLSSGSAVIKREATKSPQSQSLPASRDASSSMALSVDVLPNLLTGANLDRIVSIDYSLLSSPRVRFLLYGGLKGFVRLLDAHHIEPDSKTMAFLIDLMNQEECLTELRPLLKKYNLKMTIILYNILLKKFAKANKYFDCQEIIKQMQNERILPDIMTFGALTFCCLKVQHAKKLLKDMAGCNTPPNHQIIGALVTIACSKQDLGYVAFMLDYVKREHLNLTKIDIEKIDLLLKNVKKEIANKERQNLPVEPEHKEAYKQLSSKFTDALESSNIQVNTHPWSQFETSTIVNQKSKFNSFVKLMKQKRDIKMRKEKPQVADYNDEID